jgi:hypothetical protein
VTKKGCPCKQSWSYQSKQIWNYCGNPDSDAAGEWCLVSDKRCQGQNWGYCFPQHTAKHPCGPACQKTRNTLVATRALFDQLTFKYADGKENEGTFAYVMTMGAKKIEEAHVIAGVNRVTEGLRGNNGVVPITKPLGSHEISGRKVIHMCPTWYNLCRGDIPTCKTNNPTNYGTTVSTLVHETMHHFPVGLSDYLYYRGNTQEFVKENRKSKSAMAVARNAADPVEYFVADTNGYRDTGR